MHSLTKEQKIENLDELISLKQAKIQRIQKEISDLKRKREKISTVKVETKLNDFKVSETSTGSRRFGSVEELRQQVQNLNLD